MSPRNYPCNDYPYQDYPCRDFPYTQEPTTMPRRTATRKSTNTGAGYVQLLNLVFSLCKLVFRICWTITISLVRLVKWLINL